MSLNRTAVKENLLPQTLKDCKGWYWSLVSEADSPTCDGHKHSSRLPLLSIRKWLIPSQLQSISALEGSSKLHDYSGYPRNDSFGSIKPVLQADVIQPNQIRIKALKDTKYHRNMAQVLMFMPRIFVIGLGPLTNQKATNLALMNEPPHIHPLQITVASKNIYTLW